MSDDRRWRLHSGYVLGVEGGSSEKDEAPHPLPGKGLRLENKWRGRRGDCRTSDPAWQVFLTEFRAWCASVDVQAILLNKP